MEAQEYLKMAEVEDHMWWYRALHKHLLSFIGSFGEFSKLDVLDAGCGTGGFLRFLEKQTTQLKLTGVDIWQPALKIAASRQPRARFLNASVNKLPFPAASFDCIVSADVLEHRAVEPATAVREAYRVLRPGGVYVINATAYDWLKSAHDTRVGIERRFTSNEIRALLKEAGFAEFHLSYWNTLLFPLVVLRRKVFSHQSSLSDVKQYPLLLDAFFSFFLQIEYTALRSGLSLPFGSSVIAAAKKEL